MTNFQVRYRESYRVAKMYIKTGKGVRVAGLFAAGLIWLLSLVLVEKLIGPFIDATNGDSGKFYMAWGIVGVASFAVFMTLWLIGTSLSAKGQMMMAQLDATVQASPFLRDDEKRDIMGV